MLDPFGIVKPILGQYYLSIAKSLAEPMAFFLDIVARSCTTNLAIINPHWKGVNFYRPFSTNKDLAEAMFLAENSEYASEKVLCVVYCVESYQQVLRSGRALSGPIEVRGQTRNKSSWARVEDEPFVVPANCKGQSVRYD